MTNRSRLAFLFQAYFNKTATPAEREELMGLLDQAEHDEQIKGLLTNTWEQHNSQHQPFTDNEGSAMLAAILQDGKAIQPVRHTPVRSIRWWHGAAAAVILLGLLAAGYWSLNRPVPPAPTARVLPAQDAIVPGGNKAVLTLADGSTIALDPAQQGTLAQQGHVKVSNSGAAVLTYAGNGHAQEMIYNTLATPRGGQYQLLLADGTKVWLNASSSISYPVSFKGKERKVMIQGEVYFEVAKDPAMPFKVVARDATVEVLGTHFNIMSYEDEHATNTTLLEGSVKVLTGKQQAILTPGQQSKVAPTGEIKIREADIEEVMAWKNGWFQFNSWDIERIMRQVARWYDVDIAWEGPVPTGHFSGVVSRDNNIGQVLKIMQAGGVRFNITGRKVTVSEN